MDTPIYQNLLIDSEFLSLQLLSIIREQLNIDNSFIHTILIERSNTKYSSANCRVQFLNKTYAKPLGGSFNELMNYLNTELNLSHLDSIVYRPESQNYKLIFEEEIIYFSNTSKIKLYNIKSDKERLIDYEILSQHLDIVKSVFKDCIEEYACVKALVRRSPSKPKLVFDYF